MADTKVSALTAAASAVGTQELPVNEAGASKKVTLAQALAYIKDPSAASVAAQTLGTADTYLTGSDPGPIVAGRLKAGTTYRCVIDMTKTAAGTAVATITLRMGTAGTVAGDAAICTFTFPSAQTAAVDNARFTVEANVRSVGAGTAAVVEGVLFIERTNTTTGFLSTSALQFMAPIRVTSSGFDSTTVTHVGLSVNGGASSAWTTQLVKAELQNLAA